MNEDLRAQQPSLQSAICLYPTTEQCHRTSLNQSYLGLAHRATLLVLSILFSGLAYANHEITRWAGEEALGSSVLRGTLVVQTSGSVHHREEKTNGERI